MRPRRGTGPLVSGRRRSARPSRPRPGAGLALVALIVSILATVGLSPHAAAQEAPLTDQLENLLDDFELRLEQTSLTEEDAFLIQRGAASVRAQAAECVRQAESGIEGVRSDLARLGEQTESDTAEVIEQRVTFQLEIDALERRAAACRLIVLRAERDSEQAAKLQSELSAERLFSQGQNALSAVGRLGRNLPQQIRRAGNALFKHPAYHEMAVIDWLIVVVATALAVFAGVRVRQATRPWCDKQREDSGEIAIRAILARSATEFAPIILGGAVASLALAVYAIDPGLDIFALRIAICVLLYGLGRGLLVWFTGPYSPGVALTRNAEMTAMVRKRFHALLLAVLIGLALFGPQWLGARPTEEFIALRAVLTIYLVTCFVWVVRMARRLPAMRGRLIPLRGLLILASIVAVGADLAGFRNLANYLLAGVLATMIGGLILWTLLWIMRNGVQGISHGKTRLSNRVRGVLGLREDASSAELGWLRLVTSLGLWLAFGLYLIWVWDTTGNAVSMVSDKALHGVDIREDVRIVPINIVIGFATFGVLIALTAWIKARLEKQWLRETGMDRGSRDAIVTLAGYVGFVIAALLGLVLAGVEFAGLALVAGALSVGIGFGLQNIVNNFVSGLILLFERPIKSGDFVSVGAVEGWVRNIRIRSTEIETLDRQNVIVPNSELVSTQVVNWVLHDSHGRLRLPVGVAYGTDTETVIRLLEDVAKKHNEVITQGRAPGPRALFMGFGDSSLDFELRVWIRQIERRFAVTSDLNVAIDKAFREHGIEIPFPQRDLHLRDWSERATVPTERRHPAGARDQEDADFGDDDPGNDPGNDRGTNPGNDPGNDPDGTSESADR